MNGDRMHNDEKHDIKAHIDSGQVERAAGGTDPASRPRRISLSLVSHTNVGKTTLARTLLGRDIGDVRDEAHVTDTADRFPLVETENGDSLILWDTPGFGDSARLAKRLLQADKPLGWLTSQVWDRVADRALYSSQQAVRNVRDEADVVLYLVNASEDPVEAGYVSPEMKILEWIGKPIVVLINQMGPPPGPAAEQAEVETWARHLSDVPAVRKVLPLDAFARCWVQEGVLLHEIARWLPEELRPAFARLEREWLHRKRALFDESMQILAARIARAAIDREEVEHGGLRGRLRDVGTLLKVTKPDDGASRNQAMKALAERVDRSVRESTTALIRLHGLEGEAGTAVLTRLAEHYAVTEQVNEGKAAVFGGLVTGALAGLKADILSGGLTLGGGLILGGILGAAGAAGLARGYNMVRGAETVTVSWTSEVLNRMVSAAIIGYLAVAHYGRGRGRWAESESPAHWENTVNDVLREYAPRFDELWRKREQYTQPVLQNLIQVELTRASEKVLARLYPNAIEAAGLQSRDPTGALR